MGMDVVAQTRRATRKKYSAEEKIRIVLNSIERVSGLTEVTPVAKTSHR